MWLGIIAPFVDSHSYSIELQTLVRSMLSIDATKRPSIIDVWESLDPLWVDFKQCLTCHHIH
jgi:hypothetical protein